MTNKEAWQQFKDWLKAVHRGPRFTDNKRTRHRQSLEWETTVERRKRHNQNLRKQYAWQKRADRTNAMVNLKTAKLRAGYVDPNDKGGSSEVPNLARMLRSSNREDVAYAEKRIKELRDE